ncbi:hypothetical protein CYLTODRAFT_488834 [Cylindrobasidium torrendii FP15055 ss-10]|uniref:Uncharacterized protein n=1 Tax=Cylindrobasidium torrendii FP15055 ss-10 TaxID=1314674 RepID=A0A0D7BGB6_9AGAR|nr:hypothetical protein CYLTODRAFT_488834 [Cylindrobasidium torrendii FP15055 ss-10]
MNAIRENSALLSQRSGHRATRLVGPRAPNSLSSPRANLSPAPCANTSALRMPRPPRALPSVPIPTSIPMRPTVQGIVEDLKNLGAEHSSSCPSSWTSSSHIPPINTIPSRPNLDAVAGPSRFPGAMTRSDSFGDPSSTVSHYPPSKASSASHAMMPSPRVATPSAASLSCALNSHSLSPLQEEQDRLFEEIDFQLNHSSRTWRKAIDRPQCSKLSRGPVPSSSPQRSSSTDTVNAPPSISSKVKVNMMSTSGWEVRVARRALELDSAAFDDWELPDFEKDGDIEEA